MYQDPFCSLQTDEERVAFDKCSKYDDPFTRLQYHVIVRQEIVSPEPPANDTIEEEVKPENTTQKENETTPANNTEEPKEPVPEQNNETAKDNTTKPVEKNETNTE